MSDAIFAGDDTRLEFTVYKPDGTAQDLTGMDIVWGLGDRPTSSPTLTKSTANTGEIDVVDAANGRFDVILVSSDTAGLAEKVYYHEVELTDANGNEFTVFEGNVRIRATMV